MQIATADLNQDGYDDLLFSSTLGYAHGPYIYGGGVFVYYGSQGAGPQGIFTLPVKNTQTCTTPNSPTACNPQLLYAADDYQYWFFGSSLVNLGDVNGDGYPDIGIGANEASPARNYNFTANGVAYIYESGPLGLGANAATTLNINSNKYSWFGSSMTGANFRNKTYTSGACSGTYQNGPYPVTNKNCVDVMVGEPGASIVTGAWSHGIAHLFQNPGTGFSGSLASDNGAVDNIPSKPVVQSFQNAVIAGDINGDGYADVVAPIWYTGPMGPTAQGGFVWSYPSR